MLRTIVEERQKNITVIDVFSKLSQERILFIDDVIDDELSNGIIAQMLHLDSLNNKLINIYINSPGGSVFSGLAIYDVSKLIKSPIRTVCVGQASSMAAVLMFMGEERCGLKHSRIMLHQISGGARGGMEDMRITVAMMEDLQKDMYKIIEENTSLKDVEKLFKFDKWFTAKEALESGILTKIL